MKIIPQIEQAQLAWRALFQGLPKQGARARISDFEMLFKHDRRSYNLLVELANNNELMADLLQPACGVKDSTMLENKIDTYMQVKQDGLGRSVIRIDFSKLEQVLQQHHTYRQALSLLTV